ncbi:unnamed protein product [Coccothraustes coccothraustes]
MRRYPATALALLLSRPPLPRSRRERVRGRGVAGSPLGSPLCRLRGRPQARLGPRHEAETALEAGAGVVSCPWEAESSLAAARGCSFLLLLLFPLFPSLEQARRWPVPAGLSAPFPAGKERSCCDAPGSPQKVFNYRDRNEPLDSRRA